VFAVSKNNPHRGGILTCAHMLPPSSQRKSSQREDFELGLCASDHLKNNPPKGRIPKRWDKNPVQEILPEGRIISRVLLIEGYLHISTFYSGMRKSWNGGNRVWWVPSTPPIGKLEPLGLISGEKVLQDGWQGWMDMSKCRNA